MGSARSVVEAEDFEKVIGSGISRLPRHSECAYCLSSSPVFQEIPGILYESQPQREGRLEEEADGAWSAQEAWEAEGRGRGRGQWVGVRTRRQEAWEARVGGVEGRGMGEGQGRHEARGKTLCL